TSTLCIHELFDRRSRRPTSTIWPFRARVSESRRRATSPTTGSGASSIFPLGVRSTSGTRGCNGLRSTPGGPAPGTARGKPEGAGGVENRQGQGGGVGTESVAVRTRPKHQVEDALGTPARRQHLEKLVRIASLDVGPGPLDRFLHQSGGDSIVERGRVCRRAL